MGTIPVATPLKKMFSSTRNHYLPTDPLGKVGIRDLKLLPIPWHGVDGTNFLWLTTAPVSSRMQWSCHVHKKCPTALHPILWPLHSFHLLFYEVLWDKEGTLPFMADHSTITCSQHFEESWGTVVAIAHWEIKLLWPNLTSALICGNKQNYLQGSLMGTSCPFSKTIAIDSTFVPMTMTSQTHTFDQICNTY